MEDDGRMGGALSGSGSEEMVRAPPPTRGQVIPRARMRDAVVVGRGAGEEEGEEEKQKKEKNGRRPL
jgi:hypothetical protein